MLIRSPASPGSAMRERISPMDVALEAASAAADAGEVPVGAVIIDPTDGTVVAKSGNATRRMQDPTAHAEILAIRAAAAQRGERLTGLDLYVTLEPCAMCAGAISAARIRTLFYGAEDPKSGGVDHGARVFAHPTCHHRPAVFGGIREHECAALIRMFFKQRRIRPRGRNP